MNVLSAWIVHLYTAAGAIVAFLAATAVVGGRYRAAFLWLAAATAIDATDGVLARYARVRERLPTVDGSRLDDIVDYLTYVFVPMLLLSHAGRLPDGWGMLVAAGVLASSALGFAATDAKTDDHFFTGFPSYWNIVVLYLYAGQLSPVTNAIVLVLLSALVFWRVRYVYPTRTPVLRRVTMTLGTLWGAAIVAMILALPDVPAALYFGSLFFPIYYVALSIVLHLRSARREPGHAVHGSRG